MSRRTINTILNNVGFSTFSTFNKLTSIPPKNNQGNIGDTRFVRQGLKIYTYVKTEKGWQRNVFEKNPTETTAATSETPVGTDVPTITLFTGDYTQQSGGPEIELNWTWSNATGITNQKLRRRKKAGGTSFYGDTVIWNGSSWVADSTSVVSFSGNTPLTFTDNSANGVTNSGQQTPDTFLYTLEAQYGSNTVGPEAVEEQTGTIFVGTSYSQTITYTENGSGVSDGETISGYWSDGKLVQCASASATGSSLDITAGNVPYTESINQFNIYGDFQQTAFGLNKAIFTNTALNSPVSTGTKYTREGLGLFGSEPSIYKTNTGGTTTFYRGAFPNAVTSIALNGTVGTNTIPLRITANTQVTSNFVLYKRPYGGSWDSGTPVTPDAKGYAANTAVNTDITVSGLAQSQRYDFKVIAQGLTDSAEVEVTNANLTTSGTPSPTVSVSPSSVQHIPANSAGYYYSDVVTVTVTNGSGSIFIQGVPQGTSFHVPQYRVASSASDKITSGGSWTTASIYAQDTSSTITPSSGTVYVQFRSQLSYKAATDEYRDGVATFNFREVTSSGTDVDSTVAGIRWATIQP